MQPASDPMHIATDAGRLGRQPRHVVLDLLRRIREPLPKHPEIGRQERHPLGDVIVQFARKSGALLFAGVGDAAIVLDPRDVGVRAE